MNIVKKIKSIRIEDRNKIFFLAWIFVFAMIPRVWTLNQIGQTWDEFLYISQGYKLTELIKKGDFNNSYFYTSYDHPPLVKYLYGITAHFDVEKIVRNQPVFRYDYTYSRMLSAVMFSLGALVVALIGWRFFSPSIGIIAGVILSMLPFSLGLSQLVTAESLKILVYPATIYTYILILEKFSWKKVLIAGIATGFALQAKQSNVLLIPILAALFYLQYRSLKLKESKEFLRTRVKAIIAIIAIGVLVFFVIWPQSLFHLGEIYNINQKLWRIQFSSKIWQITLSPPEVFFGRLMLTPVFYYIVYFFITIPLAVLVLFFIGLKGILNKRNIYKYIILLWFSVPFIMSFYSWRQHGLRYIIEIYPAIAIIAAVGFDHLTSRFFLKLRGKVIFSFLLMLYLLANLWYVKPYYLDYFNELVGGTGTVYKYNLFQTGWWGQGEGEAGIYFKNNAPKGSTVGLALSPEHTFPRFDSLKYSEWSENKIYDFVVINHYHIIRDGFDDSKIRQAYKLIHEVKADGATLVYIYGKR